MFVLQQRTHDIWTRSSETGILLGTFQRNTEIKREKNFTKTYLFHNYEPFED